MAIGTVVRLCVSVCICLFARQAHAALLDTIQGEVMVNRGNGYRFVGGALELNPGDMVIANGTGSAQLYYSDGCAVQVLPGSIVTVDEQSPCSTQAVGTSDGITPGTFAFGAFIVGGGIGAAVLLGQGNDKGASP